MTTFEVYYGHGGIWEQVGLAGAADLPAIVKSASDVVKAGILDTAIVTPRLSKTATETLLPRIVDTSGSIVAGGSSAKVGSDTIRPLVVETATARVFGPAYTDTIRPIISETSSIVKLTSTGGSGVYGSGSYGSGIYGSGSSSTSTGFSDTDFEAEGFDSGAATNTAGTPRLITSGNKIVRADNSNPVILRGGNFMNHEHQGILSNSNFAGMRNTWRGNIAMIGYSTRGVVNNLNHPYFPNTPYRTILDNIVAECKKNNMYVVFAPRWSGIEGRPAGQDGIMSGWSQDQFVGVPPQEALDSLAFLATRYMNDTNVMFAAQVESNGTSSTDPSWATMKPYYQAAVDAVRATGNSSIVMTSGIDYGKNIAGAVSSPLTGTNIVYKAHVYNRQSVFQTWFGAVHDAGMPVFIGEFGPVNFGSSPYIMEQVDIDALLTFCRTRGIGWCGWAFEAGQNPAMITDNGSVEPTSWATTVKAEMMRTPTIPGDADGVYTPPAVVDTGVSISRGKPTYSTAGNAGVLVDGIWDADSWRVPYPNSFSVDLSSAPVDQRGQVTFVWNGPQYNSDSEVMTGTQYNRIANYTLYGNAANGDQPVPSGGWVSLGIFSNTRRGRVHSINLTGYNWFRMTLNSGDVNNDQVWNKDGDISKIEIINGSAPVDSWMFHGDSITCAGSMVQYGIASKVEAISPARRPIFEMLGVPGTTAADYATGTLRTKWIAWLDATSTKNVTINFGTNDAGAEVLDSATLTSRANSFDTAMRVLISDITSRNRQAWIPKIPWSTNAQRRTNAAAFNTKIEAMYGTNVGRGPDFSTLFANRTDLLADEIHPNDAGYAFWANEWAKVIAAYTPGTVGSGFANNFGNDFGKTL